MSCLSSFLHTFYHVIEMTKFIWKDEKYRKKNSCSNKTLHGLWVTWCWHEIEQIAAIIFLNSSLKIYETGDPLAHDNFLLNKQEIISSLKYNFCYWKLYPLPLFIFSIFNPYIPSEFKTIFVVPKESWLKNHGDIVYLQLVSFIVYYSFIILLFLLIFLCLSPLFLFFIICHIKKKGNIFITRNDEAEGT